VLLPQVLEVNPQNVLVFADIISDSADIQNTVIHFGPGTGGEILLEIPLYIDSFNLAVSTIVITLGIDNEYANSYDSDLKVGVTDRDGENYFWIPDAGDYCIYSPCFPIVRERDDTLVSGEVPRTFKMTIEPRYKYGYCETAHDGGYSNAGVFDDKLDVFKDVYFRLIRDEPHDEYFIRYISIDVTSTW